MRPLRGVWPQKETVGKRNRVNPHISNILPLTTLRTIDLGDKKNSTPLLSIFCDKTEFFFEDLLHQKVCIAIMGLRQLTQSVWPARRAFSKSLAIFKPTLCTCHFDLRPDGESDSLLC